MIKRTMSEQVERHLFGGKAILLFGPRQAGKTTLVESLLEAREEDAFYLNGDEVDVRASLSTVTSTGLEQMFAGARIVFIDEAQRIEGIGLTLKLCVDRLKDVQIIATGSSAFDLASSTMEPLTGRKYELTLLPLSFDELARHFGEMEERRLLHRRVVYGSYPEVVTSPGDEEELLKLLASSYLFKDVLALGGVKKPAVLEKLVRALALQVGSQVSYNELAGLVGVSARTVETYVDVLEKAFVVFRLPALARNVRNEIKKSKKIYFYDNGIRNAVIANFAAAGSRADAGALWENYLVSERIKLLRNRRHGAASYFWRTAQQQEIDYVEEKDGEFDAYEFKWSPSGKARLSTTFTGNYPVRRQLTVTPDDYHDFLRGL